MSDSIQPKRIINITATTQVHHSRGVTGYGECDVSRDGQLRNVVASDQLIEAIRLRDAGKAK